MIGEGTIRYVDEDTVNLLQYGRMGGGSALMFSENLTKVDRISSLDIPLYE